MSNRDRLNTQPRITKAPIQEPVYKMNPVTNDWELVEPIPVPDPEPGLFERIGRTASGIWKGTRFAVSMVPATISTLFKVRIMPKNNDKATTIIGWIKTALLSAGAIFLPEIEGIDQGVHLLGQVVLGVWGLIELIQAWLTNKPNKV